MENEIKEMLGEEIKTEIENLGSLEPGSKEHSEAVESLVKLYKLKIEETKNELDSEDKKERRRMDKEQHDEDCIYKEKQLTEDILVHKHEEKFREVQLSEQVKDRYIRIGLTILELAVPLMFYASWVNKGLKFEEEGTFTSTTFRGVLQKLKPTKKG